MPDWVIWVAIGVLFMSWRRSQSCCRVETTRIGKRRERRRDRLTDARTTGMRAQARLASASEESSAGKPQPGSWKAEGGTARRESPLEALQRRFVRGSMTVEQYEAELDRLDRLE